MKDKNIKTKSVVELNQELEKTIKKTPPIEVMIKEIKMMNLKIRPIFGDLSKINFYNHKLLKTLWQIGKLEEFYYSWVDRIKKEEKKIFYQMIVDSKNKIETKLQEIKITDFSGTTTPQLIEMELFKEKPKLKN